MSTLIPSIDRRSPAERAGVRPGERLLSINSRAVEDVLDYRFFGYDANPLLELEARCTDLYQLCRETPGPCGLEWTTNPVML